MDSVWTESSRIRGFQPLKGDLKTDVLIVGGGMAGILCGYFLQQAGVDYAIVEADTVCSGITKNTTAKITSQHGLIYHKLVREFGVEKARMYLDINEAALKKYRELCKNIDCDFEDKDSYVYSTDRYQKLEQELNALNEIGFDGDYVKDLPLPFQTEGAVRFKNQALFHPLKFIASIAENLNIYEHTKVLEFAGLTASIHGGTVTADHIIIATHYPILNKHGAYFAKEYQNRSYVLGLLNATEVNGMYVDEAEKGLSFRNYKDLLLLGGGSHRTGKKGGKWQELEAFSQKYYPDSVEKYRWATQDCMTLDQVPYIGLYGKSTKGLYVTTGFNKWGMTSSMVSAMILTDLILGKENPYAQVFSPRRTVLRPQLVVNLAESTANLLTISKKRCPHMGCALKWNPEERTWDCPCHGSRFTKDGELIDNPATDDLN
ncbi:FAD-dependent oxidoreductase [Clostridium sp. MCC353]|uniref:FAD-dependent oxidoreductase n=1 Tax=Clostridium sp. MCC353 TaxID=2592646 RepID=UPI001C02EF8F|nr:FAD-dependent oxidoreductase [Clostridium sp. MCC353]MBT9779049.1 FAD-dependent oxidoreductase [Clostridium sp. MCC353]